MRDSALVLVLILGVALVARGLYDAWQPATYLWVGWCLLFVGWRLVRTR